MSKQTLFFPTCVKVGPIKAARDGDGGGWIWGPVRIRANAAVTRRAASQDNQAQPAQERIYAYLYACSQTPMPPLPRPASQPPMPFHLKKIA